jgi:hypothetical protein
MLRWRERARFFSGPKTSQNLSKPLKTSQNLSKPLTTYHELTWSSRVSFFSRKSLSNLIKTYQTLSFIQEMRSVPVFFPKTGPKMSQNVPGCPSSLFENSEVCRFRQKLLSYLCALMLRSGFIRIHSHEFFVRLV